jgi:hypothetical protein
LIADHRAVGVQYRTPRGLKAARRAGEVIVSGGVYGSLQLLLSGIGPGAHLTKMGLRVVRELAAVGANLHDHFNAYVAFGCAKASAGRDRRIATARSKSAKSRGMHGKVHCLPFKTAPRAPSHPATHTITSSAVAGNCGGPSASSKGSMRRATPRAFALPLKSGPAPRPAGEGDAALPEPPGSAVASRAGAGEDEVRPFSTTLGRADCAAALPASSNGTHASDIKQAIDLRRIVSPAI